MIVHVSKTICPADEVSIIELLEVIADSTIFCDCIMLVVFSTYTVVVITTTVVTAVGRLQLLPIQAKINTIFAETM